MGKFQLWGDLYILTNRSLTWIWIDKFKKKNDVLSLLLFFFWVGWVFCSNEFGRCSGGINDVGWSLDRGNAVTFSILTHEIHFSKWFLSWFHMYSPNQTPPFFPLPSTWWVSFISFHISILRPTSQQWWNSHPSQSKETFGHPTLTNGIVRKYWLDHLATLWHSWIVFGASG